MDRPEKITLAIIEIDRQLKIWNNIKNDKTGIDLLRIKIIVGDLERIKEILKTNE